MQADIGSWPGITVTARICVGGGSKVTLKKSKIFTAIGRMGNSPSRSTSSEYLEGTNSHHPEGNTGQRLPFNPFDFQGDDNHSRRVNFPLFSDAMMQTEDPDSGPSIDTLASMYPIDFPLR